jgi:antitoxin PrlF
MELISGKMTSKGQITIPNDLREKFDLHEGDQLKFLIKDDEVKIKPMKKKQLSQAIGKITGEQIDIEIMRKIVQEEASQHIFSEGINDDE